MMSIPKWRWMLSPVMVLVVATIGFAQSPPPINIQDTFVPSGWMGDGEYGTRFVRFTAATKTNPHSPPDCIRISYTFGPKKWAGIYWQNKANNWGDWPGNDYSGKGYRKIVFWARGESGGESVRFKAGGINNPGKKYHDSFEVTLGRVRLTKEWKKYEIDVAATKNLSGVIGGFCWVASRANNNTQEITFYLDDIRLE